MTLLALFLTGMLWLIAAIHVLWGTGSTWPTRDAASLARQVVGGPGIKTMPPAATCFAVAILLIAIGCWPLWRVALIGSPISDGLGFAAGIGIVVVFCARGLAPYVPAWRRLVPEEPFATFDRHLYGPLCLLLAAGFTALLLKGSS
jgi:Protein of unknown function (DUF3995)